MGLGAYLNGSQFVIGNFFFLVPTFPKYNLQHNTKKFDSIMRSKRVIKWDRGVCMKKILIGVLALGSVSAFANTDCGRD